ncbi:hypothetical protein LAZ67_19000507, partial [Cordylochernes scorpioides]
MVTNRLNWRIFVTIVSPKLELDWKLEEKKTCNELARRGQENYRKLEGVKKTTGRSLDELQVMVTNRLNWRIFVTIVSPKLELDWKLEEKKTYNELARRGQENYRKLEGVKKTTGRSLDELQVMVTNRLNWRIFVTIVSPKLELDWKLEEKKTYNELARRGQENYQKLEGVKKTTGRSLDELQVMVTNRLNWRIFVTIVSPKLELDWKLEEKKTYNELARRGQENYQKLEGVKKTTGRSLDELQVMVTNRLNWRIFVTIVSPKLELDWKLEEKKTYNELARRGQENYQKLEGVKKTTGRSLDELQVMVTNRLNWRIFVTIVSPKLELDWKLEEKKTYNELARRGQENYRKLEGVKKTTGRSLDELQVMVTNRLNWRIFVTIVSPKLELDWKLEEKKTYNELARRGQENYRKLEGVKKTTGRSLDELQVMVTNRLNWRIFVTIVSPKLELDWKLEEKKTYNELARRGQENYRKLEEVKKTTGRSLDELQVMVTNRLNWRIFVTIVSPKLELDWKLEEKKTYNELARRGQENYRKLEGVKKTTGRSLDELQVMVTNRLNWRIFVTIVSPKLELDWKLEEKKTYNELARRGQENYRKLEGVKKTTGRSLDELQVMVTNRLNWRIFVTIVSPKLELDWKLEEKKTYNELARRGQENYRKLEGVKKTTRRSLDELQVMVTNRLNWRIFVTIVSPKLELDWKLEEKKTYNELARRGQENYRKLEGVKKTTGRSLDELQVMVTNRLNWRIFVTIVSPKLELDWKLEEKKTYNELARRGQENYQKLEGVKKTTGRSLDELQVMVTNRLNWRIFVTIVSPKLELDWKLEEKKTYNELARRGQENYQKLEGVKKTTGRSLDELQVMVTNRLNWRIFVTIVSPKLELDWKLEEKKTYNELARRGQENYRKLEGVKKTTGRSLDELQVMVTNRLNWRIFVTIVSPKLELDWKLEEKKTYNELARRGQENYRKLEEVKKTTGRSLDELQVMVTNRLNWRIFVTIVSPKLELDWKLEEKKTYNELARRGQENYRKLEGVKKTTGRSLDELQVMVTNRLNWRIFVTIVSPKLELDWKLEEKKTYNELARRGQENYRK